ncbi:hypothetical protein BUALT_Bualt09G0034200 [Buddleja alternifolia]|uniref:Uncharacterized protein n=1 Tax=Buddleja alternifolia TaxID=168488 RepID=A0AAV6X7T3_9LAMI|nr:hypothetical protein BUALT_Bualt09G0034200 [Buddleja alternifolia]
MNDLRRDVDMLVEQMRINSEQLRASQENQDKGMEDLRNLITTMTRNQGGARHGIGTSEDAMEGGAESQNR